MNGDFWRGRRVFVTGHTGFKGSWLCLWLEALGAEVVGLSSGLPTSPALFELARVGEGVESISGDVRDREALAAALAGARPEVVIHMAAQPLVRRSFEDPVETYATNVLGTAHLLEAVRGCDSVRAVVNVTSDKCYAPLDPPRAHREDDPKGGSDPYSSSKACAELVADAYRASFFGGGRGPGLASARAGNVIGGGDWSRDRLVPDLVRAALAGEEASIRNPGAVRPWQHVLEPLSGYLLLAERLWEGSPEWEGGWNFGPDARDARPVREVVELLSESWEGGIAWREDERANPPEAQTLELDTAKARADLGWRPRWDLDRALERVARWHLGHAAGEDPRALVLADVEVYEGSG